jgi:hypothetical protein
VTRRPTLSKPLNIDRWWRNRRGETILLRLSTYEGHNLIDLRTWFTDTGGTLQPGKGFCCSIKHLPRIAAAFAKAAAKARELGLIGDDEAPKAVAARGSDDVEPVGKFSDLPRGEVA